MKPKVKIFTLGGTIASAGTGGKGVAPTLGADALVAAVPQIAEIAEVEAETFRQLPSPYIGFDDVQALAAEIEKAVADGAKGVVVTQGTDTLEETGFLLDRLVTGDAPVVLTGAMRNPTLPGADGPANLHNAVMVAVDDAARGIGAMIVFNGDIHAARYVRKGHTQSTAAFRSQPCGQIGWIAENTVRIVAPPMGRYPLPLPADAKVGRIALLKAAMGDDGALVRAVLDGGFDGLIVEATGGGHVTEAMVEPVVEAATAMPVVLTSRTDDGEILRETYMFPGSEMDLLERGLIDGGWLDGPKARLLLGLLIARGASREEIKAEFGAWLSPV